MAKKRSSSSSSSSESESKVAKQGASDDVVNPWTGKPYSAAYYELKRLRERLPIAAARTELLSLVDRNQFVVLVGETGSGKTTQVPNFLAEHLLLPSSTPRLMVGCTQPRRVAAMSVARRVAQEMDVELGAGVGYTIRFEDKTTPDVTVCKYLTDGMLLREALTDPTLSRYKAIVLDEAHERTVATDLLLGLLKQKICPARPDLKVVVMSATLEANKFQRYLGGCPLLTVPGRTFPVDIFYSKQPEADYFEAVIRTVARVHDQEPPGDILVFLTGEEEIEEACRRCKFLPGALGKTLLPLPLYSSLPPAQQERIFDKAPAGLRKVIFATNIAETSLTIDGVVYVVDPGFHKQKIFHPQQRLESLLVSPISQASAKQRAGRAGRTQPGKCFRLYTEQSFQRDLKAESYPEILRCNLANVILQLKALAVDDLVHFDFVDPPAPETLMRALETLLYIGALSEQDGSLTKLGWQLSELPLDPCLGRVLLAGVELNVPHSVTALVACLSVPPVFVRPNDDKANADASKASLSHPDGDHLTLVGVFDSFVKLRREDGDDVAKDWCWEHYVSHRSLSQAVSIYDQLRQHLRKRTTPFDDDRALAKRDKDARVIEAVVAGFFMQAACRLAGKSNGWTCVGPSATVVKVHPSTCLLPGHGGDWLVFHEQVMTSQAYLRTVTSVSPALLLKWGARFYSELATWPRNDAHRQLTELVKRKGK